MPHFKLATFNRRNSVQLNGRLQDNNPVEYSYDELSTNDADDDSDYDADEPMAEPGYVSNYFNDAISLVAKGNRCKIPFAVVAVEPF